MKNNIDININLEDEMKTIVQVEIEVDEDGSIGVGVLSGTSSSMLSEMIEEGVMGALRNVKIEDLRRMI